MRVYLLDALKYVHRTITSKNPNDRSCSWENLSQDSLFPLNSCVSSHGLGKTPVHVACQSVLLRCLVGTFLVARNLNLSLSIVEDICGCITDHFTIPGLNPIVCHFL